MDRRRLLDEALDDRGQRRKFEKCEGVRRGILLFIGDRLSHWNDATGLIEPYGTSLEEQNDMMDESQDHAMCHHKKKGVKAIMTNNARTRGQLVGIN